MPRAGAAGRAGPSNVANAAGPVLSSYLCICVSVYIEYNFIINQFLDFILIVY